MPQTWPDHPEFKLVVDATEYINDEAVTLKLIRPENSVATLLLRINDYLSSKYIDIFDVFTPIQLHLRQDASDAWTKVFAGIARTVSPHLSLEAEIAEVLAVGEGHALTDTHCNISFGKEGSDQPAKDTPKEIWDMIVDDFINKSFSGGATGYAITKTKIANITTPVITHIHGRFMKNFDLINKICEIRNAGTGAAASVHWFVDPDKNLFINTIGNHENDATGWPTFWKGSEAASTIVVKEDQIQYQFQKRINHFANHVLLAAALRKPPQDYWTESGWTNGLWSATNCNMSDDAAFKVVGANSLNALGIAGQAVHYFEYPTSGLQPIHWDFTQIESPSSIPSINFYAAKRNISNFQVILEKVMGNGYVHTIGTEMANENEFYHFSIPFGNYYKQTERKTVKWNILGAGGDWSDTYRLRFAFTTVSAQTGDAWIDDLHFAGRLMRAAKNSTSIAANNEFQRVVRNDAALDDSLKAADDSGMLARLAYAELLRRQTMPLVGVVQLPLMPTVLPGQLIHIHACQKADDTYRVDENFRIKELIHLISTSIHGTTLNLTNDLTNSFTFGPPTRASILAEYVGALGHKQARDMKLSGDIVLPRLTKDYPS